MRVAMLMLVPAIVFPGACSNGRGQPGQLEVSASSCSAGSRRMQIIENTALQQVVNGNGSVAVVRVVNGAIKDRGTRSERATHRATVLQQIYGEPGKTVEIWYRTAGGVERLKPNCEYAVALGRHDMYEPAWIMRGFTPVEPDSIEASVDAHRRALEAITKK